LRVFGIIFGSAALITINILIIPPLKAFDPVFWAGNRWLLSIFFLPLVEALVGGVTFLLGWGAAALYIYCFTYIRDGIGLSWWTWWYNKKSKEEEEEKTLEAIDSDPDYQKALKEVERIAPTRKTKNDIRRH
jgi:hypothetical protein